MQTPAAGMIVMGQALLKDRAPEIVGAELKELRDSGIMPPSVTPGSWSPPALSDFEAGYLLGLETVRTILAMTPAAVAAGVEV